MAEIPEDALRLSWDDVYNQSVELASMIEEQCARTGEQFDVMVVLPRGGYYPANIVARELGFGATDLLHASIGSYDDASTNRQAEFKLGQMPAAEQVKGKNVLVIDEVCDTGQTLKFLTEHLHAAGAELVRVGVLHYKPSLSKTDFVPDWKVGTTDKWIVYPWEPHEQKGLTSKARRKTAAKS
jgi:hypoxanthine phosphoribosyltransferase